MPKLTPQRTAAIKSAPDKPSASIRSFALSQIVGLHPCIELLHEDLSIPPFRLIPRKALTKQEIERLLTVFPLTVSKEKRRLRCTGNIRLFRLATHILSADSLIPCIVEDTLPERVLIRRALAELINGPACLGVHFSEIKTLAEIVRKATSRKLLNATEKTTEAHISNLYGVDRRQLKVKIENSATSSETNDTGGSIDFTEALSNDVSRARTKAVVELKRGGTTVGYFIQTGHPPNNDDVNRHKVAAEGLAYGLKANGLSLSQMLEMAKRNNAA